MNKKQTMILVVTVILLFLGALFWAERQDPFSRKWFTLKTSDYNSFQCVAIIPKPARKLPVVIYLHGLGGSLLNDGKDLRKLAELGLASVSFEYDQNNEAAFVVQFQTLQRYLVRQDWVNTNAIAWIGYSLGAIRIFDFVAEHPEQQPQLLIELSGRGLPEDQINRPLGFIHCPVLLIHGERDELFPVLDSKRLFAILQTNVPSEELKIIPNVMHGLEPEREVIFRSIGEYCLTHMIGEMAWQNYFSISRWQAEAPKLWPFCLPALVWICGWFIWFRFCKPKQVAEIIPDFYEVVLRWAAILLGILALAESAIHLVTPHLAINDSTLDISQRLFVSQKECTDFKYLIAQPISQDQKLEPLIEHVKLAAYNRELVNWQVDDMKYDEFILSPVITGEPNENVNWRRSLWEEFYPLIRHEPSPETAAQVVVRHLRERVTIAKLPNSTHEVQDIWLKQITDEIGFQIVYVAALRSVGVPARLNVNRHAEFWGGKKWQTAPDPSVLSW